MPTTNQKGVALIKSYETLRLHAYPATKAEEAQGLYTIGYGHAGVPKGMVITEAQAEEMLKQDLAKFEKGVAEAVQVQLTPDQFAALVSLAFNIGVGAFQKSTLVRLLNKRDWAGAANQFGAWIKQGDVILEGLVLRRAAEKALFLAGTPLPQTGVDTGGWRVISPPDAYQNAAPITSSARQTLELMARLNGGIYKEDAATKKCYFGFKRPAVPKPAQGEIFVPGPHYDQRDSQIGQSLRMCYSSSDAMMAASLRPGIAGNDPNWDDKYLQRLLQVDPHGDTTESSSQLKTLAYFKIECEFRQNLDFDDVIAQLEREIRVPLGFLHHGHISNPYGGGHWVCAVGVTADRKALIVNDPYGEIDLIAGEYISTDGRQVRYSLENFGRRWMLDEQRRYAPGRGWGMIAKKPA